MQRARDDKNVGVVKALLEANAVEAELLRQAVSDQSVDAVFDLLQWKTGEFAFVMDEVNPDDVGVTVQTETVVADADARRASWETVSTSRTTTVRRSFATDTNLAADWAIGANSLGAPNP